MSGVVTGFAVIWTVTLVGYLVGRTNLLGPHGTAVIARLVFLIATPALLLGTLARSTVADLATPALAVFVLSTLIVAALYLLVARLGWRGPPGEATVGALCASYVNAANLGLPVAAYVLGDVSFVVPVLIFQVLLAAPLALGVLDAITAGRGLSVRRLALLPARNPIMLGSAAGLLISVSGWDPPAELLRPFDLVGSAAVPLALLALGMSLPGARPLAGGSGAVQRFVVVGLKIVVQPVLAYAIARFGFGLTGPVLLAAVVTSALPTAQNVFVFATHYGQAQPLARDAVVLSTVAAAVSLAAIAALLG
ncbi:AEC family transporter [Plantactinospora sp. WMMC1484]|uniref:AEC family transporter n=1 Tax=Plantactinospora sp. WMMC1484 TaxID=3404122 RepID=UPI003BF5224B